MIVKSPFIPFDFLQSLINAKGGTVRSVRGNSFNRVGHTQDL